MKWLQIALMPCLVCGALLLLCLAYQYPYSIDLTRNRYNSLIPAAESLLSALHAPVHIELISQDPDLRKQVQQTIALFSARNALINFTASRKHLSPSDKTRLGLEGHHHLLLQSGDQLKAIDIEYSRWNQRTFAQALYQLLRRNQKWTLFLQGHGELDPFGKRPQDLYALTKDLRNKGIRMATLHLGTSGLIPDNTQLLVIANPRSAFLPKETLQIQQYIAQGGNVLWFADPDQPKVLNTLASTLGAHWPGGLIIDPQSHALGTPDPAISLVQDYPSHPLNTVHQLSVFPWSTPIEANKALDLGWEVLPFLRSNAGTFLETKPTKSGPFALGISLSKGAQRVVLLGNAQCFNNATLHNYGNLQLATNLFNWLNDADLFIHEKKIDTVDLPLTPSLWFEWTVRYGLPYGLPLLYLLIGWQCRRVKYIPKISIKRLVLSLRGPFDL